MSVVEVSGSHAAGDDSDAYVLGRPEPEGQGSRSMAGLAWQNCITTHNANAVVNSEWYTMPLRGLRRGIYIQWWRAPSHGYNDGIMGKTTNNNPGKDEREIQYMYE